MNADQEADLEAKLKLFDERFRIKYEAGARKFGDLLDMSATQANTEAFKECLDQACYLLEEEKKHDMMRYHIKKTLELLGD